MSKRAVLYARVSSDDTKRDGRNLAGQLEMCRKYATEHGYEIIAELHEDDRGASGAAFELEQLNHVRDMARAGEFNVLIVREIDRLSRSLAKQLVVEEELRRGGVQIEYVLGEYPDSPEGRLNKHIKATIAEYEREKITERTTRARRLRVKAGSILAQGHRPFGYNIVKVDGKYTLRIIESEARYVRLIYTWYRQGDGENGPLTMWQISNRMTALGVPTVADTAKGYNKIRGYGEWSRATVAGILKNETYAGAWRYGKSARDPDQLLTVAVPPIVSRDAWEAVSAMRENNRRNVRRQSAHEYLMQRRLSCAVCGAKLQAYTSRTSKCRSYYQCRSPYDHARPCNVTKVFRADQVDATVWEWVKTFLLDPQALAHGFDNYQDAQAQRNAPLTDRLSVIDDLLTSNRAQLARLLDLYLTGEFTKELLTERKVKLETTIKALARERGELAAHLTAQALTSEQIRTIQEFAAKISSSVVKAEADFTAQRRTIETLNVEGVVAIEGDERVVYVRCLLKGEDVERIPLLSNNTRVDKPCQSTALTHF